MASNYAVGIDLGTTNSCVAICKNDRVEIIENEQGYRVTPSWVTFTEDIILTGPESVDESHQYIKTTVFEAKRLIGQKFSDPQVQEDIKRFPYEVFNDLGVPKIRIDQDREYYPEEISAFILARMKVIAEARMNEKITRCVVTVPAYFNDAQRQATKDAATIAGFATVNVINEPTAAALAFSHQNKKDYKRNILVYDFGGGTFDISIVTIGRGKCEVKVTKGDCHLGGTDIDMKLVNFIKEDYSVKYGTDIISNDVSERRLKSTCEKLKKKLSAQFNANIEITELSEPGKDYIGSLTRVRLEQLNETLFEKTLTILDQCIQDSGLNKTDIDEVVLVGGSSKIPKIQEMLQNYFGSDKINKGVNPDEAVAYGAAIHAANLAGDKNEVVDVTSLSLGTNTYGDLMSIIIPNNTPIPAKSIKRYQTIMDNQNSMEFPIYQGEREIASENYELGNFTMTDLTESPARTVRVEVSYSIDAEGILHVSATEINNAGNSKEIVIDVKKRGLSPEQIQDRIEEAEKNRQKDLKRRQFAEEKYTLERLLYDVKAHAEKCTEEDKDDLLDIYDDICKWLDKVKLDDLDKMLVKQKQLRDLMQNTPIPKK
ncbi:hypothetical protein ILUMI_12130 [Ignelater luminosus]|uniref:Heat shock protein 70 n=1 Tax=Ignelater luminosus TaxID=2038154 RepID=A0A8K0GD94_IGNLU|nr:hypothetical protein ILUMI_12130 [Ignelater luminosus]